MQHSVTIWANRSKVVHWVNCVLLTNFSNLCQMMHMNKVFANVTIDLLEIKVTNCTKNIHNAASKLYEQKDFFHIL